MGHCSAKEGKRGMRREWQVGGMYRKRTEEATLTCEVGSVGIQNRKQIWRRRDSDSRSKPFGGS